MTPEGKVKKRISALLKSHGGIYYFMPVPSGYGESSLDYIGCYCGRFFAIETKAPGKVPTPRQTQVISLIEASGGAVFVIDGTADSDVAPLKNWLFEINLAELQKP